MFDRGHDVRDQLPTWELEVKVPLAPIRSISFRSPS